MFNPYTWKLYKESKQGKAEIRRWSSLNQDAIKDTLQTPTIIADDKGTQWDIIGNLCKIATSKTIANSRDAQALFETIAHSGIEILPEFCGGTTVSDDFRIFGTDPRKSEIYDNIEVISYSLFFAAQKYFFPFSSLYLNYYESILSSHNLPLPSKPKRTDFTGRALYYLDINETLYNLRRQINLEPAEFAAYINSFCYEHITSSTQNTNNNPRVWFAIAGNGENDFEFLDEATHETVTFWHANSYIRQGDIILMYCMTPRKYIHSIWRAHTNGFTNPFFFYYDQVWLTNPVKIPPVELSELKINETWSKHGAIRASMQGAYRHFISNAEYNELCSIILNKNRRIKLPQTTVSARLSSEAPVKNEKGVESQFIEPLLHSLGYKEQDWARQLPVRMGRQYKVYPDYAIIFDNSKNNESARLLIEAKYKISSTKDFESAYYQLQSYGLRLRSKALIIASTEGIWIFQQTNKETFSPNQFTYFDWASLHSESIMAKVSLLIGKQHLI